MLIGYGDRGDKEEIGVCSSQNIVVLLLSDTWLIALRTMKTFFFRFFFSCCKVEPPVLENAAVDISYVMNEIRGRYVMLATYTCFPGFKFLNDSANKLYCRNLKWGAPDIPKCVSGMSLYAAFLSLPWLQYVCNEFFVPGEKFTNVNKIYKYN